MQKKEVLVNTGFKPLPLPITAELVCSECSHPLSVGPILLKLNGQNICGRCNYDNPDTTPAVRNHAYEAAVSSNLFPCMYKSTGCSAFIPFNDPNRHESMCCFRSYRCPAKNDCLWVGTVKALPEHYLSAHFELTTENPVVEINLEANCYQSNLLYFSGLYFLLQSKSEVDQGRLWFNLVFLGDAKNAKLIHYELQVGSSRSKSCITLEERPALPHVSIQMDLSKSVDVDIRGVHAILKQPSSVMCTWKIKVDSEFLRQRMHLMELRCVECDNYMIAPIYVCNEGHTTCADCKNFEADCNWCKAENQDMPLVRALFLEELAEKFKLPCRWRGCLHESKEIREHEKLCPMRQYKCPLSDCKDWSGSLDELISHFKSWHPRCRVHVAEKTSPTVYQSGSCDYIIAHGEVFWCHFEQSDDDERLLQLYYKGSPSLAGQYRYELEVVSSYGATRVYELERFIKNRYEVRVPMARDSEVSSFTIRVIKRCESYVKMRL